MVDATARAHGWRALSLRYFNVAGAGSPELADPAALNLIPMVLDALAQGRHPQVFGEDYPTPDGTCIRDYIHVADLSSAHVAAARVVEAAHAAKLGLPEPPSAMRSATERVQHAAALAEMAAARLPGGQRVVSVAAHMPGAAEAAAEVAARAAGRVPAAARMVEAAAARLPGAARAGVASASVREQTSEIAAEVATRIGALVARVAGVPEAPALRDHMAINIGTGRGHSVLEVIDALRASVGEAFEVDVVERRPGDPAALVAAPDLAAAVLGWRARHSLSDMTDSAWAARKASAG
jgi:UDP-glucose 4-epimerase